MAAPNLLGLTTWLSATQRTLLTTTPQTILVAPATDHIREVLFIRLSNQGAVSAKVTVTVVEATSATFVVAFEYKVSARSVVNIQLGREDFLQEADSIVAVTNVNSNVVAAVGYNDLS